MIVADTHVIIWDALRPEMLSNRARKAFDSANKERGIIICDISLWEIAMLMNKGRLKIEAGYLEFINLLFKSTNYVLRSITPEIAELSTRLFPRSNKDPADRIISATAIIEGVELVTSDTFLRKSKSVPVIW